jgi:transcriptional regulator with XRE-family HTH domain
MAHLAVQLATGDTMFYVRFGQLLARARKRAHVSQEALARSLGLSRTSITNIEHGRQPIQLHSLYKAAGVLNVQPKELLPDVGDHEPGAATLSVSETDWLKTVAPSIQPKGSQHELSSREISRPNNRPPKGK